MTLSVAMILVEAARRHGDRTALVEGQDELSYAELWTQVRHHAAALAAHGVRAGDRVALISPNTMDFVRSYYAILALGAVVVPVPLLLVPDEASYLLRSSGARLAVCHTAQLALGGPAAQAAEVPLITVGPGAPAGSASLTAESSTVEPITAITTRAPEDPAVVFYTSGTTGRPKGAVLTQLNLVMNATVNAYDANHMTSSDVVLGCLPLFHVFGQTVSLNSTFRVGASLVLQPKFDPGQAIELMLGHGVTVFNGVPTMYIRLLEAAEAKTALPSPRLCVSGGASLPVSVLERFNAAFTTSILEGYGLSETSPTATVNQPDIGTKPGTVGHPVWGVEVEVADAAVEHEIVLLPTDAVGEIVVRGHNVFAGYLDNPEATAEVLIDGWFRTGDLGRKDAEGFISIVDRKKDLIIRNGYNVYPREVEEALARHPDVVQVAVIGLPHAEHGEEVCAVIVPREPALDSATLIDWARGRLAQHKFPRRVELVDELPLGPSQKVLKRELRSRFTTTETR